MNRKKFWKTFFIALLIEVAIVAVALGGIKIYRVMNDNIGGGEELEETLSDIQPGEARNLVVFGTDKEGARTDVIMVISVHPEKNALTLLSVPRDTKVKLNGTTYKINAALAIGGEEMAVETVMEELDIPIHDYMIVNFQAVETLIDELGGVQFEVPCDMDYEDPEQDLYIHINQGDQLLNGEDAVKVLRYRSYVMGDLERNKVQQDFFRVAFQQKFKPKYISKVPAIYELINENIRSNLSLADILAYLDNVSNMENRVVQTFELPVTIADPFVIINEAEADTILDEYYRYSSQ